MTSLIDFLQTGTGNAALLFPSALILGALHGLEPGHSKTMMAAFIIAVRGTVLQAALLGVSATVSHTLVVWIVALGGMYLWQGADVESIEPYLQIGSAVLIVAIAAWMVLRMRAQGRNGHSHAHDHDHDHTHAHDHDHGHGHGHGHTHAHDHDHAHDHAHGHSHDHVHDHDHVHRHAHDPHAHGHAALRRIDTGHGVVALEIYEAGVPPRWRLRTERGRAWQDHEVSVEIVRPGGARETYGFVNRGGYLESVETIPEPHQFTANLSLQHAGHTHDYALAYTEEHEHAHAHAHAHEHEHAPAFVGHGENDDDSPALAHASSHERSLALGRTEDHGHGHDHGDDHAHGLELGDETVQDAHALAHANDIRRRFASRDVTTGQIVLFGLTGGLIPCGAAVTVLLLCLQLKKLLLGAVLVFCFSVGLALTLVAVGVATAAGVQHAARRLPWFDTVARRAPYLSAALILVIGCVVGYQGFSALAAGGG
ncbi:MAG TPA: nickel/cobalt efflux transporter [Gammaproteobacteria bacterium]|nr:nickel/cobalt efflux transporter [Gammaproteobacteria bacterium]